MAGVVVGVPLAKERDQRHAGDAQLLRQLTGRRVGRLLTSGDAPGHPAVVGPREDVLGVGAALHVHPSERVPDKDRDDQVREVLAAHRRARRATDDLACLGDDRDLLLDRFQRSGSHSGHGSEASRRLGTVSVSRVMGIETEYGISVPGQPAANAMLASSQVVNAYAAATREPRAARARWDFDEENPLRDARGFDLSRDLADASQLTDEEVGLANVILTNGARLYVDHAHPEYSSPEVLSALDAVRWDKAGELVMAEAGRLASRDPRRAARSRSTRTTPTTRARATARTRTT